MRNLIRSPLTWMVVAEMVVVGALIALAWNAVGSAVRPAVANPAVVAPDPATRDTSSLPDIASVVGQSTRGPLPGLNTGAAFWRARLAELNREEAWVAQLEWRLVHASMVAARDYVERVVLPSITRAERAA